MATCFFVLLAFSAFLVALLCTSRDELAALRIVHKAMIENRDQFERAYREAEEKLAAIRAAVSEK